MSRRVLLADLQGSRILDVGTVHRDSEGERVIYFYLDNGLTIGVCWEELFAATRRTYEDVWSDFEDFIEPHAASSIEPRELERVSPELRLADLLGRRIDQVQTTVEHQQRWVYLHLDVDIALKLRWRALIADGAYDEVWGDFERHQKPVHSP